MILRIASWNINSIRIRQPILRQLVDCAMPDVICLQETKAQDQDFPLDDAKSLGFEHIVFSGQKSYNGVAILSRLPLTEVECLSFIDKDEKRHIAATLPDGTRIHNLYIPAGGDIPDVDANPKFKDKLAFVDALTAYAKKHIKPRGRSIILGDMNIAPLEHDVWSHKQLLDVVSHTPIEVEKMSALQKAAAFVDTHREHVPADQKLYSWWSYRSSDWMASDRGRRLDHIWTTPDMQPKLAATSILSEARGWEKPSDHVPIWADFEGIKAA